VDKTLAPQDSGVLFWQHFCPSPRLDKNCLKTLFSSKMGYSYTAFRQAVLMYEEAVSSDEDFDNICSNVASEVQMHPEILNMLHLAAEVDNIRTIVITCGIRRVWQYVIAREGLSETVKVIGGGRICDEIAITPEIKGSLVEWIKQKLSLVWAFGDSPLDLSMMKSASRAIIVTGPEGSRSKTMDKELQYAIGIDGFHPLQVLLPPAAPPRLDTTMLPLVNITSPDFLKPILPSSAPSKEPEYYAAKENVARALMTAMRDQGVAKPTLRAAHHKVGWYLTVELLTRNLIIGTEKFPIQHVQGTHTDGYRIFHEKNTLIVALMRGGESMALGVSDAMPLAGFLHAKLPTDMTPEHLQPLVNIILVDSIINSGKTMNEFLRHIRQIYNTVNIVVVAGVIQQDVLKNNSLIKDLHHGFRVKVVALRLSANKYTGRGGTDTGHRLFNTVRLT
jgi:uracil phosphoribosyltransferase